MDQAITFVDIHDIFAVSRFVRLSTVEAGDDLHNSPRSWVNFSEPKRTGGTRARGINMVIYA